MSDPTHANNSMSSLYPPFAAKVTAAIAQATRETTGKHGASHWVLVEGLRSQARQDFLYAQGRTRPGAIVTHRRVSNHSSGLAADCYPVNAAGQIMWDAADALWEQWAHCVRANGLQSGRDYPKLTGGTFVDNPHCEPAADLFRQWAPLAREWLHEQGLV